jgi:predicted nucleic acid-binding protein
MRLYLDANAIIYAIESALPFHPAVVSKITAAESAAGGLLITSYLSRLECRSKPLRGADLQLLSRYEAFFSRLRLQLSEITPAIIESATDLRARYNLNTPDAIHLATAIEEQADVFLTGDAKLARCTEVKVEIL